MNQTFESTLLPYSVMPLLILPFFYAKNCYKQYYTTYYALDYKYYYSAFAFYMLFYMRSLCAVLCYASYLPGP